MGNIGCNPVGHACRRGADTCAQRPPFPGKGLHLRLDSWTPFQWAILSLLITRSMIIDKSVSDIFFLSEKQELCTSYLIGTKCDPVHKVLGEACTEYMLCKYYLLLVVVFVATLGDG